MRDTRLGGGEPTRSPSASCPACLVGVLEQFGHTPITTLGQLLQLTNLTERRLLHLQTGTPAQAT